MILFMPYGRTRSKERWERWGDRDRDRETVNMMLSGVMLLTASPHLMKAFDAAVYI